MTELELKKALAEINEKLDLLLKRSAKPARGSKKETATPGTKVWEAYEKAYVNRYGTQPIRNAKANSFCKNIFEQIGLELALQIVVHYVESNDQFYVRSFHPLGLCVANLQKLCTEFKTGTIVTGKDARRIELERSNERAINQYLKSQTRVEGE